MNLMNERTCVIALRDYMDDGEGWGREQGREVFRRLLERVEAASAGCAVFRVSMRGVDRADISFASETLVELARRFRGSKGFCLIDLDDPDVRENYEAAAARKAQPLIVWTGATPIVIGTQPSQGTREALEFALQRPYTRAAEFALEKQGMTIANASMKFKQLWEQGFLLREESAADTGGVEYVYSRIG
jgi:hypothetical protein